MARITGVFYLLTIVTGIIAQGFLAGKLIVPSDAGATATNIAMHASTFRLGFSVYMIEMACQVAITGLFYELLKPVSRSVSLISAFFSLVGCAIKTTSRLFYLAPLLVVGGAPYLSVFNAQQLQALSMLFLKINDHGAGIGLFFFGVSTLIKGYLIIRSTFLPRILGALSIVAGLGWLTFVSPPLGFRLFPYIGAIGLLAAAIQIVWLLVFGVNEERWREQAAQ
jgi:hypothetical protein